MQQDAPQGGSTSPVDHLFREFDPAHTVPNLVPRGNQQFRAKAAGVTRRPSSSRSHTTAEEQQENVEAGVERQEYGIHTNTTAGAQR